jgi:type I restriction enzyme S subunit
MTNRTLDSIVSLQRGNSYKSKLLGEDGPKLLGLGSIAKNGGFKSTNLKTYGGPTDPRHLLHPGDIYVSLKDVTQSGDLLGSVARVPTSVELGRLTQDTVKLKFRDENFDKNYLYWALRTPEYRNYCRSHALGTTNLSLSREDFLSFELPTITEGRVNLTQALEGIEAKIELNRRMNETLEGMARALFRSWFVDFDPVHARAAGEAPAHMPPETAALFPARFGDDGLPEGWRIGKLSEIVHLTMGQSPPGDTYNGKGEGLPFYQGRKDFGFRFPSRRQFCIAPQRIAECGDTMLSVRAPVGDSNLASERCCIGRGVAAVSSANGAASYTYYLMGSMRPSLDQYNGEGTIFGSINKKQLSELAFTLPPKGLILRFDQLAAELDARIKINEEQSATLSALRDALLPKLMSGELRVRDAEAMVEGYV